MHSARLITSIAAFDPHGRWFQADHPERAPKPNIFDLRWSSSEGMMIGFLFGIYVEQFDIDFLVPAEVLDWMDQRDAGRQKDDWRAEMSDWFWPGASRAVAMFQKLDVRNSDIVASLFSAAR